MKLTINNASNSIRNIALGVSQSKEILTYLGYSKEQLIRRLMMTMPDGFSWKDFEDGILTIDHIIPRFCYNHYDVHSLGLLLVG